MRPKSRFALLLLIALAGLLSAPWTLASDTPPRPEVTTFIEQMTSKHGFDRTRLTDLLAGAKYRQDIIDAITRPAEAKPWHQYRPIFVTEERAQAGAAYWQANEELLKLAEDEFGVPAAIIVAIIGVETRYGGYTGKYRVLDALTTLAFGYPKRSAFFLQELEAFLLLTREEGLDPTAITGSYAGAMGKPQFISSSFRRYAIDFDRNGIRDLWQSDADVIGSVANYFVHHGWQRGQPISAPAVGVNGSHTHFVQAGMKPSLELGTLANAGISSPLSLDAATEASLIELDNGSGNEYWLGLNNFYVITRYNHSNLYAMAVYQLSEKIRTLHEEKTEIAHGK